MEGQREPEEDYRCVESTELNSQHWTPNHFRSDRSQDSMVPRKKDLC